MDHKEKLKGGKGDNKKISDFDEKQIAKGLKVETEHTDDPAIALEIVLDHLSEDPKYYDKLEVMEKNSMEKIKNATVTPRVYYGLHMVEGVAHYRPNGLPEYTIFVGEHAIKSMNATFVGKPVYVDHVDIVDMKNLESTADGYVIESFYNKSDGKTWCKFIVVTDKGHEAIRNGWRLSNAYLIKETGPGGRWHGVDYSREVVIGEYEHLAIVQSPRYDESVILTPEQFKEYNLNKENELSIMENSIEEKPKEKKVGKFNLFKRTKVENQSELNLEELMIKLPISGLEVSFERLVNMAEEKEEKEINGDDMVKVGDKDVSINELKEAYIKDCARNEEAEKEKEENEEDEEENEVEDEAKDSKRQEISEEVKNKKKKKNSEDKDKDIEEKSKNSSDNFDKIKNAELNALSSSFTIDLPSDQLERGKARYGSN